MRVRCRPASRRRRRRILKRVRGYSGARHRLLRAASVAVIRAQASSYRDRRRKKRDFRRLWITRLSAASKNHGLQYSRFIHGLKKAGIVLNRKQLSELAIHDPQAFTAVVDQVKTALAAS